jgi:hypothetical protein
MGTQSKTRNTGVQLDSDGSNYNYKELLPQSLGFAGVMTMCCDSMFYHHKEQNQLMASL